MIRFQYVLYGDFDKFYITGVIVKVFKEILSSDLTSVVDLVHKNHMTLCNKTGYDMECNFIMSIPWIIVLQITGAYENTFGIFFPFFFFAYEHSLCN